MNRGKHDGVMDESVKRSHHGSTHPSPALSHKPAMIAEKILT